MTPDEVRDLLNLMAAFDNRTVKAASVEAWTFMALRLDWNAAEVREATLGYYAENVDFLMPVHITQRINATRHQVLDEANAITSPTSGEPT